MKNFEHYKRGYYMPPEKSTKWVEKEYVDTHHVENLRHRSGVV